jgi:hypothetical protein
VAQEELAEGVGIAVNVLPEQFRVGGLRVRCAALPGQRVPGLGAAGLVRFRRRPPLSPGAVAAARP